MAIRSATPDDMDAVLALLPRLTATGVPLGRDEAQVAASDRTSVTRAITQPAPGEVLLIAHEDDALFGFVHVKTVLDYFSQRSIAHIADIVVADSAEGQGIGKALMGAAETWARDQGYAFIQLHVLVGNARARNLYERLGYSPEWLKYIKALD